MAHKRRDPKKEASWRRIICRQARSGVTVRAWCLDRQVSEATFHWWRRELARRDGEPKKSSRTGDQKKSTRPRVRKGGQPPTRLASASPAFVPVRVSSEALPADGSPIAIVLPNGRCIRVRGPVDRQTLADVVASLEHRPGEEKGTSRGRKGKKRGRKGDITAP